MLKIKATDVNGRRFSMMTEEPREAITEEWVERVNEGRRQWGRAPIATIDGIEQVGAEDLHHLCEEKS